jgi:ubiquinone/menaquinone biosynthesis C-methylase UbiE
MQVAEAVELLEDAVATAVGTAWVDFGAGDGTFTLALARLLPAADILAVDRDRGALLDLEHRAAADGSDRITTVVADFTRQFELPAVKTGSLHGMLFANSLHFVRNPGDVLAHLVRLLRPGGRVVFVEYDRRRANPWVPYPIDAARLPEVCRSAGLSTPLRTATRPSDYGGDLFVAFATLSSRPPPSR